LEAVRVTKTHALQPLRLQKKGVRVKKGLVGEITEGAGDILKGAGKELDKLFGK